MAGQFMVKLGFLLAFGGLWIGCGGNGGKEKSRTRDVVFQEIQSLPTLYLTGKTRSKVTAPAYKGQFVDENGLLHAHDPTRTEVLYQNCATDTDRRYPVYHSFPQVAPGLPSVGIEQRWEARSATPLRGEV